MSIRKDRQDPLRHDLRHEIQIVWEENPEDFDYVREIVDTYPHRRRIKKWRGVGRRVGYSVVAPDAPNERGCLGGWLGFYRREFYLMPHDRAEDPTGVYETGCPIEGVDPLTVRPGIPGQQNSRAWNGSHWRPAA
jgi:Family of unknown function (DUF6009)